MQVRFERHHRSSALSSEQPKAWKAEDVESTQQNS
jgi:hypothetical protein